MNYFKVSSSAYYSVLSAIPLLLMYEILLHWGNPGTWVVRNAADVWLRYVFQVFEINSYHATFFILGILFVLVPLLHRPDCPLKPRYFLGMFMESFLYSLCLGVIIHGLLTPIFFASSMIHSGTFVQRFALSLGAGLFEEFLFRVLCMNALFLMFHLVFRSWVASFLAIFLAAFLFSLSHYIGVYADPFNLYSFLFRFFAGLLFTLLYTIRGFGIVVYTHAWYDIGVLL